MLDRLRGRPLQALEQKHGIKAGETTEDGKVSLVTARCLGACGLAPAVVFDGEVAGKIGTEATLERVRPWSDGSSRSEEAQP